MHFELDLRSIQDELRQRDFIRSSEALGPTREVFGTNEHGYRRIDDSTFLHVMNFETFRPYTLGLKRENLICIQIVIGGTYNRLVANRVEPVTPSLIQITNYPHSITEAEAGTRLRGIMIVCERQYLLDHFGLNIDRVPVGYRPIFLSETGMAESLELSMSWSTIAMVDQIISYKAAEPLKSIYIRAKTIEILCDIVGQINRMSPRKPAKASSQASKLSAIEAAAAIYRREIRSPPTIEQLAARVGLNRNELTAGFRDHFGATPHVYGHLLRMEQARALLDDGQMSISEIARHIGYGGYSSFSRAYHAQYGHAPSWTTKRKRRPVRPAASDMTQATLPVSSGRAPADHDDRDRGSLPAAR